jgi:hypothetical protein
VTGVGRQLFEFEFDTIACVLRSREAAGWFIPQPGAQVALPKDGAAPYVSAASQLCDQVQPREGCQDPR